jgi:hypothetical protein
MLRLIFVEHFWYECPPNHRTYEFKTDNMCFSGAQMSRTGSIIPCRWDTKTNPRLGYSAARMSTSMVMDMARLMEMGRLGIMLVDRCRIILEDLML